MELRVIEASDELTHLALVGRLDIAGVGAIETKFTASTCARKKTTLLDLSGVDFLSSLGIRLLLSTAKSLQANGVRLILINPQANIRETLTLSSLDQIIPIVGDKEEALGLAKTCC